MSTKWRLQLLGGLRADRGDCSLSVFRTQKTAVLLGYLAYYQEQPHSREKLAGVLWPDAEPRAGLHSLSQALYWLRCRLGLGVQRPDEFFSTSNRMIAVNPAVVSTDVAEFHATIRSAAGAADSQQQVILLTQAVELYRGELLAGYYEDWIHTEQGRLEDAYSQALAGLIGCLRESGDAERAIHFAQAQACADPCCERAHRELMRLHAAVGEPVKALRQYRLLERILHRELGCAPSPSSRALAIQVERLADSRALAWAWPNDASLKPAGGAEGARVRPSGAPLERATSARDDADGPCRPDLDLGSGVFREFRNTLLEARSSAPLPEADASNRPVTVIAIRVAPCDPRSVDQARAGQGARAATVAKEGQGPSQGVPGDAPEIGVDACRQDAAALLVRLVVDCVLKYEGRVLPSLDGEALLLFGAVPAHENDSERALLCAAEIRDGACQLRMDLQMAVHTGWAVARDGNGSPETLWDVVRRACFAAPLGRVLVTEATRRSNGRGFRFSGRMEVPGLGETSFLEAALFCPGRPSGLHEWRTRLIGRSDELARLKQAAAALVGGRGQVVWLVGDAGIGKSRLVDELRQSVKSAPPLASGGSRQTLWLEGRCLDSRTHVSYWPFVDLFWQHFGLAAEEGQGVWVRRIREGLQPLVLHGCLTAAQLDDILPRIENLLSCRSPSHADVDPAAARADVVKTQTFLAIRDMLVALAKEQPLALVFEDLHWADQGSLDLLSFLMDAVPHHAILLLLASRVPYPRACQHLAATARAKHPDHYTEIHLGDLTPQQSCQLVESLLNLDLLPDATAEALYRQAHGNPLFLEEVAKSLSNRGGDACARQVPDALACPDVSSGVQALVLSRFDRLESRLQRLLERAAVVGPQFAPRLLARLSGVDGAALDSALWDLQDQGLVYEERVVPELEYSFKHALTQQAIYHSIGAERRAALHRQVAETLADIHADDRESVAALLAYHYERSDDAQAAVDCLIGAGRKCRRHYLYDDAIGYFERALKKLAETAGMEGHSGRRLAACLGLGQALHSTGRDAGAEDCLRQAMAEAEEMKLPAQETAIVCHWLGNVLHAQARYDEMIREAQNYMARLGSDSRCPAAAVLRATLAAGYLAQADVGRFLEMTRLNARLIQRLPYTEELRPAYLHVAARAIRLRRNWDDAMEFLERAEQSAAQGLDMDFLAQASCFIANDILARRGDHAGAVPFFRKALDAARATGSPARQCEVLFGLINALLLQGDVSGALRAACEAVELQSRADNPVQLARCQLMHGCVLLSTGDASTAVAALERGIAMIRQAGATPPGIALAWLGWARLRQGLRPQAIHAFQASLLSGHVGDYAVAGLDAACLDPDEFTAVCRRLHAERPDLVELPFSQWSLKASRRSTDGGLSSRDLVSETADLAPGWSWIDLFGDSSLDTGGGVTIQARNGRDLWGASTGAPRLLWKADRRFAAEAVCASASPDKPAMGGILIWRDSRNWLRLDRGTRGTAEVTFSGCIRGACDVFGRGRLPGEHTFLRLERLGTRVEALCSADGARWWQAGVVDFPIRGPVDVGLHAIGTIDRVLMPGAYPDGTAIRFLAFRLWTSA